MSFGGHGCECEQCKIFRGDDKIEPEDYHLLSSSNLIWNRGGKFALDHHEFNNAEGQFKLVLAIGLMCAMFTICFIYEVAMLVTVYPALEKNPYGLVKTKKENK